MDNSAFKAAAQKELMRRAAKEELDRRAQSQPDPQQSPQEAAPSQGPSMIDLAYGLTPMGVAQNLKNAVMNPRQTLQTADNVVRTAANGMTAGYADKFAAYMNGPQLGDLVTGKTPLERESAKSSTAYEKLGAAGPLVEAGAFMLPATALAKVGLTASALPKIGGLLGTTIDSAVYGGVNAAGHDQNIVEGAMLGAGLGAIGQGVGSLLGKGYRMLGGGNAATKKAMANAPTHAQVKSEKNALYDTLENAGVKFDADGFQSTLADIATKLKNYRPAKAPLTADTIENISQFNGKSPTFGEMEGMLQDAKSILRERSASDTDKAAAGIVVDRLSEFFNNGSVMTTSGMAADQVAPLAAKARELARRHILSKEFGKMENKSEWYKSGSESGIQNQIASFGKRSGNSLTPSEYAAAQNVLKKEGLDNLLNQAGTRIAMHGGSATGTVLGGMLGGPLGAMAGLGITAGGNLAARKLSGNVTKKAFENLKKTVLMGKKAQAVATQKDLQAALMATKRRGLLARGAAVGSLPIAQGLLGYSQQ